jgi:hypothetical protein
MKTISIKYLISLCFIYSSIPLFSDFSSLPSLSSLSFAFSSFLSPNYEKDEEVYKNEQLLTQIIANLEKQNSLLEEQNKNLQENTGQTEKIYTEFIQQTKDSKDFLSSVKNSLIGTMVVLVSAMIFSHISK